MEKSSPPACRHHQPRRRELLVAPSLTVAQIERKKYFFPFLFRHETGSKPSMVSRDSGVPPCTVLFGIAVCHLATPLQTTAFITTGGPAGCNRFAAVFSGRGVCAEPRPVRLAQRTRFATARRHLGATGPHMSVGSNWEGMVDRVIDDLNKGVAKYIFVRSVDPETAAELRAVRVCMRLCLFACDCACACACACVWVCVCLCLCLSKCLVVCVSMSACAFVSRWVKVRKLNSRHCSGFSCT